MSPIYARVGKYELKVFKSLLVSEPFKVSRHFARSMRRLLYMVHPSHQNNARTAKKRGLTRRFDW